MELKLAHELASVDHNPLFLVLIDLRKSYDTADRGRPFRTLEGYGAGPHLCEIMAMFWVYQKEVPQKNGYHGPYLWATWVTMQGGLISLTLFNAVVDNIIRKLLAMTVEDQTLALYRVGDNVGRFWGSFVPMTEWLSPETPAGYKTQ